jgi:hypothetical protein
MVSIWVPLQIYYSSLIKMGMTREIWMILKFYLLDGESEIVMKQLIVYTGDQMDGFMG